MYKMFKVLSKSVDDYNEFVSDCALSYIEELCNDFITTSLIEETSYKSLEDGYAKYRQSINNFCEFKRYCEHLASLKKIRINSLLYKRIIRNVFQNMRKKYRERSFLKNYSIQNSYIGKKLTDFFNKCRKLYIKDILLDIPVENCTVEEESQIYELFLYNLNNKKRFEDFCYKMNTYLSQQHKVNTSSSLYSIFLEDHYFVLIQQFS
jgi:hypothetical protein